MSLTSKRKLREVSDPERASKKLPSFFKQISPKLLRHARSCAQSQEVTCEQVRLGHGHRQACAHLVLSPVAFTRENKSLLPLAGEKNHDQGAWIGSFVSTWPSRTQDHVAWWQPWVWPGLPRAELLPQVLGLANCSPGGAKSSPRSRMAFIFLKGCKTNSN